MDRQPFRFAVQASNAANARDWREFAQKTEDLGYSTLFLADHYLGPGPAQRAAQTPRQDLAPIPAIATAAAVTTTLRVGCRVFCVDYHVPAVLAKEAVTLDLLSDGRFELGIGAGWSGIEYQAMGISFEAPGRRIAKLKEVVALVKAHCTDSELDCSGKYVNVKGYQGTPSPTQHPHPPIMIGGGGRRVLSYAAAEADIVSINTVPFTTRNDDGLTPQQEAERRYEYVRAAAGSRIGDLDIESSPYFVSVGHDDPGRAYQRLADTSNLSPEVLRDHPNVLVGCVEAVIETLCARREAFGVNYVTIRQAHIDRFAPVVARLTGA